MTGAPGWGYGPPGPVTWPPQAAGPPVGGPWGSPAYRARQARDARGGSDYIFNYWTALGWTVLTLGFYGYYVFYQLVRRMRDHNARRAEFLDATLAAAWEEAGRQGHQAELTPSFQRAGAQLAVLQRMRSDFRDPVVWLVLSIIANGLVHLVAFILLDQDLVGHERAELDVEREIAFIYSRLGRPLAPPPPRTPKRPHNYVGRVLATVFTLGLYLFWWYYNIMDEPNRHFHANWASEDDMVRPLGA